MSRLWNMVDGEPFFVNPQLLIAGANPRHQTKKGKKSMRRMKTRSRRRGRKNTPRRKTTKRRVHRMRARSVAPRRRRRANPVHRRKSRSRRSRNPKIFGLSLPPLMPVVYAGAGFVAPPAIEGFISGFLPVEFSASTLGKFAIRFGTVLGGTWLVKRFIGANPAMYFGIGGGMYLLTSAIREFAPEASRYLGLGAYTVAGQTAFPIQMGAYTRQLAEGGNGSQGGMNIQHRGGTGTIPTRLRRFQ